MLSLEDQLQQGLQFTDEDLEANRFGKLTASQKQWVKTRYRNHVLIPNMAFLGMLILFDIILMGTTFEDAHDLSLSSFLICQSPFLGFMVFGIWWIKQRHTELQTDLQEARVVKTMGSVRLHTEQIKNTIWYHLYLRGIDFELTEKQFLAFRQGEQYTVYYTPKTKLILSAKPRILYEMIPAEQAAKA